MVDVQRLLTVSTTKLVAIHAHCNSLGICCKALNQGGSYVTAELAGLHQTGYGRQGPSQHVQKVLANRSFTNIASARLTQS